MRKLDVINGEVMCLAIQQEIARSPDARYDHRLHGLLLVSRGLSCHQAADYLGEHPVTVQRWVKRFNAQGFAGLQEGVRSGHPRQLSPEQLVAVGGDLRHSPRELGYEQNLWDGKLLAHHLAVGYAVNLGVRQCQRLFHQLGFRRRKPRGVIAKGDPLEQAAYKKTRAAGKKPRD
jgi:transposase